MNHPGSTSFRKPGTRRGQSAVHPVLPPPVGSIRSLPVPLPRSLRLLIAAILLFTLSGRSASGQPTTPTIPLVGYRAPRPFTLPFLIRPEAWFSSPEQGMLMLCPAHAHGPKAEATAELIRLVAQYRPPIPATIWVCRENQLETLRELAPMVDRVCINPFVHDSNRRAAIGEPPWTGTSHALLMQLQDIRLAAPDRQLIACIELNGEEYRFGGRQPTFEEVQWFALAAIGSGFQGIAWRGDLASIPYRDRLGIFAGNILRYADELPRTQPADWVTVASATSTDKVAGKQPADVSVPCTAFLAKDHLFVVVLHPQYVHPRAHRLEIPLPVEPSPCDFEVELHPPPGVVVVAAERLDGATVPLRHEDSRILASCQFSDGGTLLAFGLKSTAQE